jgi:hypothetical protein
MVKDLGLFQMMAILFTELPRKKYLEYGERIRQRTE